MSFQTPLSGKSFLTGKINRGFFFCSDPEKYIFNFFLFFPNHHRDSGFDNTCFFQGYLGEFIPQEVHMIKTDIGYYRYFRDNNICAVQSATQSRFDDGNIYLLPGKPVKSHRDGNFKKGWFQLIYRWPDAFGKSCDGGFRDHLPVDANPFPEIMEVGRRIESGFKTGLL